MNNATIHRKLIHAITTHVRRAHKSYARPESALALMFEAADMALAEVERTDTLSGWRDAIEGNFTPMPWRDKFLSKLED